MKKTIITALFALVAMTGQAQLSNPKGLYKLSEIIHQDGKHLEAPFKQYKYCLDNLTLMINYNAPHFVNEPFSFSISNPDGKPLRLTGELSNTENKGIQIIGTSDSTFVLRWFNDRQGLNQHLFPSGTNIDELYVQVKDSTDNISKVLSVLTMNKTSQQKNLLGTWKLRGVQKTNTATSQYRVKQADEEKYMIFSNNAALSISANNRFPNGNLNGTYTPCSYLTDYAIDMAGSTYIVNWFDHNTISMTGINQNGHPSVSVWDRCGMPQNIQEVFGTNVPQMKKDVSRIVIESFVEQYGAKPDSICKAFETFDFAVDASEKNNAIFPVLMRCGFEDEYKAMKDSLQAQLLRGEMSAEEAVSRYVFWFYKNFDRHTNCSSPLFWKMASEVAVDYNKLIAKYAPEPVGCKVDDDTYLLRLPSCMGDVPTWEWMERKADEFKQSGCQYLILDLRGNSGGSDIYSLLFTRFMCDSPAMADWHYYYMVSTENNKKLKKSCESGYYHQSIYDEAITAQEGSFINWGSFTKGENPHTPLVRRGAIIVDNITASAGESPVRYVRNFSKSHAKVYGRERTNGCEQTGNCNDIALPHVNMTLRYPMTVDDTFEKRCREKNPGYKPDVIIPLDYPKQLTDNIDSWVLWVAKDLKR